MRILRFALVCILFVINSAYAFDLSSAYQSALTYNADYLSAIATNEAGQEDMVQSRGALLPQLSATGGLTENYTTVSGSNLYYHQPTAGINISQVVFDFSKFSQYIKDKYSKKAADLTLQDAKQQLITTVANAYFDVLYASDTLNTTILTKNALKQQLDQAKKSFEVGTVTIADVNDAQSAYDGKIADEIQNENDLISKKNIFQNITGLNPDLIQPVESNIILVSPEPDVLDAWVTGAKENNLSLIIAKMKLDMANEDISIAKSGHLPTLSVTGQYQYTGNSSIDGGANNPAVTQAVNTPGSTLYEGNTASLGLQISLPLYSGGSISSKVRQKISNYEAAYQSLVSLQRSTDQQIKDAFWQAENGVNIVKAQIQALKSAQLKLKSDQIGYKIGVRTSIDLVNSQKSYASVIQSYNKARYDYLKSRIQLWYLSGKIDSDLLKLVNSNIAQ